MENSYVLVFVIGLLYLSNFPKSSMAADTITPNQSITHLETIISPGGRFELGFFSPKNSTNLYVGIWYREVSPQTVVWVANREHPILSSSSASLSIGSDGNIIIFDGKMHYFVTNTSSSSNNTYATLLDSGNLILMDMDQNLQILWQSFEDPTDTFLPGMKVKYDPFTDMPWSLVSWKSSQDPAPGVFTMVMSLNDSFDGILNIKRGSKVYWSGDQRFFNLSFTPDYFGDHEDLYLTWADDLIDSKISRLVLDVSGQLKLQSWSQTDGVQEWHTVQVSTCGRSGCGAFSICSKNTQSPCGCLPGFNSAESNDSSAQEPHETWAVGARRCVRKTVLGCISSSSSMQDEDGFLRIENADFPINPLKLDVKSSMECESASLSNCSWIAYAFDERNGSCFVWDNELFDLKKLIQGDSNGRNFFLKLAASELNSHESDPSNGTQAYEKNTGNKKQLLIIVILTISLTVVTTLSFVMLCVRGKLRRKGEDLLLFDLGTSPKADSAELTEENQLGKSRKNEVKLPLFSFASVCVATDNFSTAHKLGEGGFGPVYKGTLLKGDEIAVKRLSRRSGQGWEELKNEAQLIANLQHKNLVRLFGCCIEKDEKILIYEYMSNKSLDFFIFDPTKRRLLDWGARVRIIEGIAQGLLYLHQYSRLRIIHRDLKASNILLDTDMNPKISDFGMARIFGGNESQANTNRIVGTYGYMSPEYAIEGIFSIKSDVFSFGVLLLEIVSGKKNTGFYQTASLNLLGYAWDMWTSDKGLELKDPVIDIVASSNHMLIRYVNIGLLCVQESADDRPTMSDVVSMLINETTPLPPPKQPAFSHVRSGTANSKPSIGSSSSMPDNCSVNNVTVSLLQAR